MNPDNKRLKHSSLNTIATHTHSRRMHHEGVDVLSSYSMCSNYAYADNDIHYTLQLEEQLNDNLKIHITTKRTHATALAGYKTNRARTPQSIGSSKIETV